MCIIQIGKYFLSKKIQQISSFAHPITKEGD